MRIELPTGTPAELARPAAPASRGLVISPDIGGLRSLFDEMCASLAEAHGWAVCAPEPFPGREHLDMAARLDAVGGLNDDRQLGDLAAAADHLVSLGAATVGLVGFCMGGMYAMKAAGTGQFDRVVAFYGMIRIPEQWRSGGQGEPLEYLVRPGASKTLAIVGGRDIWTPGDDIEALRAMPNVEVVAYDDAEHGFAHDASRPAHRPADAQDAWARAIAFLAGT